MPKNFHKSAAFRRAVARTPARTTFGSASSGSRLVVETATSRLMGRARSDRPSTCHGIRAPTSSAIVGTMSIVLRPGRPTAGPLSRVLDEQRNPGDVRRVPPVTVAGGRPGSKLTRGRRRRRRARDRRARPCECLHSSPEEPVACIRPAADDCWSAWSHQQRFEVPAAPIVPRPPRPSPRAVVGVSGRKQRPRPMRQYAGGRNESARLSTGTDRRSGTARTTRSSASGEPLRDPHPRLESRPEHALLAGVEPGSRTRSSARRSPAGRAAASRGRTR